MIKKNKTVVSTLTFSQVDLPQPKEDKRNDFVKFGKKNDFPNYLLELMKRSALHNAILVSKAEDIVGNGMTYEGEDIEAERDAKTDEFLKAPNPLETADDLLRKCAYDLELYGGFYLSVIWARDKKSISEVYHYDFNKMRSGKMDRKGQVVNYFYSDDWKKSRPDFEEIKAFDDKNRVGEQIIFIKPYVPGQEYYPLPSYVGAISYIELDGEVANFHLSHVKNGMNPSMIMTFIGEVPEEEERATVKRQVRSEFESSDNAGNWMLMFAETKDNAPTVTPIATSDLDKQFIQLNATILQNVLSGHRITSPMLVGIKTEGQLGGATELMNSYSIYQKNVIDPHKQLVLKAFNKIASINGLKELSIKTSSPIEFMWSESTLEKIMTQEEMRDMINLEPMEDGKVAVIEKAPTPQMFINSKIR